MLMEASKKPDMTHPICYTFSSILKHPIIVTFARVLIIKSKLSYGQLTRQG